MNEYVFFYDEIFHDYRIVMKDPSITSLKENKSDTYVGVFLGIKKNDEQDFIEKLVEFENNQKKVFMPGFSDDTMRRNELKSRDILKKQEAQYGLVTFSEKSFLFYQELFEILKNYFPYIMINTFSKIECMLFELIQDTQKPMQYHSIIYSLTKFLTRYNPQELIQNLYRFAHCEISEDEFKKNVREFFDVLIMKEDNIKRKVQEKKMMEDVRNYMNFIKFNKNKKVSFSFLHTLIFKNFAEEVKNLNINNDKLQVIIDKDDATYNAGKEQKINISQKNSKNSIQIRVVDYLCGFIGKIVKAMEEDENKKEVQIKVSRLMNQEDLKRKRKLSDKWFQITKEQFNLYLMIYDVLFGNNYPIINTTYHCDPILYFFVFLKYIKQYKTYEDYALLPFEQHAEECDNLGKEYLSYYFMRFNNINRINSSMVVNMWNVINKNYNSEIG
ncbi:hypothetical protein [uncultured Brachyspira sp.]|uniref:hypothetical protein n=1 Tax=uncultured Brachyspira sp. TaxID=221953 RepID=UPI002602E737|nr:hypothetical protein [uncultured Brachyspira sp.]